MSIRFRYRAATSKGMVRRGLLVASSEAAATHQLHEKGLSLLSIRPAPRLLPTRGIATFEVAIMFRNVSTLVRAGVPIERALGATEGLVSQDLAAILDEVRRIIREGRPVAEALDAFPAVFPRSAVGMIRAGERTSALADACASVADQLEEAAGLRSRVRAALAYPALIVVVGMATIAVMGTVVVPRFVEILTDLGSELPPATRGLLVASTLLRRFGLALALMLLVGIPVAMRWLRTPDVRVRLDRLLLRLPLVGSVRLGFASARTCRALGGMLERGMPLLAALDAARDAAGDLEVSRRLGLAREAVARGARFTEALGADRVFSPAAIQLVGVGESSGRLGPMVSRAAAVAGEQAEASLRTAVGLIEPLLVVVLGVMVALVAAALLQAVYSIRPPV